MDLHVMVTVSMFITSPTQSHHTELPAKKGISNMFVCFWLKGRRWQHHLPYNVTLYLVLFCLTCVCFLLPAVDSLSPSSPLWGCRSSCVVLFPGDGHTCDLQVVHLAAEPGTPGQAEREREPAGFTLCVFVCACNSLGDFWRAQLKLREDNGCGMCWYFPRLSLRDVWACQCCNTILNLHVCVCVCNGEGVYLQFDLF